MKLSSLTRVSLAVTALTIMTFFYSCKKENSHSNNNVTNAQASVFSDESSQAEASFDDVEDVGMTAADQESIASTGGRGLDARPYIPNWDELRMRIGTCAAITVSPNDSTYPKTITIDFGSGCACPDGKFRKGAIVVSLTGPAHVHGSVLTITLREYYLNLAHIEGSKTITNLSENGNIKYSVVVTGGRVTLPNGRGYQYTCERLITQTEGGSTPTVRDDVFSIAGHSQTVFNNGVTIRLSTETNLVKKRSCPWLSAGILKIVINDHTLYLDYAAPNNGDCDNKAMLSWNNGAGQQLVTLP